MSAAELDRSMPLTLSSSRFRIRAIPTSLFFLVPLLAIALVLFVVSQYPARPNITAKYDGRRHPVVASMYAVRPPRRRLRAWIAWTAFSALVLTGILIGALGASSAKTNNWPATLAGEVLICLSQFELGAVFLYLNVISASESAISSFKLYSCAFVLAVILLCASLISVTSVFVSMPSLLPVILVFVFLTLALPLPAYQLVWTIMHRHEPVTQDQFIDFLPSGSSNNSTTASFSPKSCKGTFSPAEFAHPRPTNAGATPAQRKAYLRIRNLWILLLCAALAALFAAASDVGAVSIFSADETASREPFRIIEATGLVLCFICLTSALMVHTLLVQDAPEEDSVNAYTSTMCGPMSRTSSFSSPRPKRNPVSRFMHTTRAYRSPPRMSAESTPCYPSPVHVETFRDFNSYRGSTPTPSEDCTTLRDPFAPVITSSPVVTEVPEMYPLTDASRLSAWGALPQPLAAVTIVQPRRMPPSLRTKKSLLGPVGESNKGEGEDGFDLEEALLAQRLLRTLQVDEKAAGGSSWLDSLGRARSLGRMSKSPI